MLKNHKLKLLVKIEILEVDRPYNYGRESTHPTVVMETKDHQNPSKQPIRKGRGNSP